MKFTLKAFTANTNANGLRSSIELYIEHSHRKAIADIVEALGINTITQFCKFNFDEYEMSFGKLIALTNLQSKLNKMKKKAVMKKVADTRKNVNEAKAAVAKVIKEQAKVRDAKKKLVAKKVAKKAVAKKQTKKQTIKEKLSNQYKVVTQYSESLMQDIYVVVYRTKELKRFVNQNLCNKYIEQEVLLKMNEKAVKEPVNIKGITKELKAEFEVA